MHSSSLQVYKVKVEETAMAQEVFSSGKHDHNIHGSDSVLDSHCAAICCGYSEYTTS